MAVDELRSLIIMLFEYFYCFNNRLENDFYQSLDKLWLSLFDHKNDSRVTDYELLNVIKLKSQLDICLKVQKDVYEILNLYRNK